MIKKYTQFLLVSFIGFHYSGSLFSNETLNRYRLIQDRIAVEDLLRPMGHDFLLNLRGTLSRHLYSVIDDAKNSAEDTGTAEEKISKIKVFLNENNKKEHLGMIKADFGIPLPLFTAFGVRFVPDLHLGVISGAMIRLKSPGDTKISVGSLISGINGIPDSIKEKLSQLNINDLIPGEDILTAANNRSIITNEEVTLLRNNGINLSVPDFNIPAIFFYGKLDISAKLLLNFLLPNDLFGRLNLYLLRRSDKNIIATDQFLRNQNTFYEIKDENTQVSFMTDFRLGYSGDIFTIFASLDEFKIFTIKDKLSDGKDISDNYKLKYGLHAELDFQWDNIEFIGLTGIHYRSGRDLIHGAYIGAKTGFTFNADQFKFNASFILDSEYVSIGPRIRVKFVQFDYMLKYPYKNENDQGTINPPTHSANLRFFF